MYDELTQRVIGHIARTHSLPEESVTPESTFDELGIDSLGAMCLVADLEIELGVDVPNEELLRVKSVGDAIDSLARVLAGAAEQAEAGAAPQG
ncbi:MAG: acyl carrier protein [Gemmatimonadetes bacterium]|nr:acyl carrier protein [Gemmatimonadota bacterium]